MVGGVLTDTPLQLITTYEKTAISVRSFRHRFRTGSLRIYRGELLLIYVSRFSSFVILLCFIVCVMFLMLCYVCFVLLGVNILIN